VRQTAECWAYIDVLNQMWLSLVLNCAVLGYRITTPEFRAFATGLLTQIYSCGLLYRDRLQSGICFPFSVLYHARLETKVS